jgi:hypothetical protein
MGLKDSSELRLKIRLHFDKEWLYFGGWMKEHIDKKLSHIFFKKYICGKKKTFLNYHLKNVYLN